MALIYLLARAKTQRGSTHDVGALAHKHTYSASTQWGEDDDNSTTFTMRYLEEVRRCSWHRCSEINAREMKGGTRQKRKAGLAKKNRRTMRRHTDLCLGQKLTYRTQQRIMRGAASACCRFYGSLRVSGVYGRRLRSQRYGSRRCLYRHLPGVLYSKDKLNQEGKRTEQRPSLIQCLLPGPVGAWVFCSVLAHPGEQ
jgi:hypothetical protein